MARYIGKLSKNVNFSGTVLLPVLWGAAQQPRMIGLEGRDRAETDRVPADNRRGIAPASISGQPQRDGSDRGG